MTSPSREKPPNVRGIDASQVVAGIGHNWIGTGIKTGVVLPRAVLSVGACASRGLGIQTECIYLVIPSLQ